MGLLLAFILVPVIEIALFIQVGSAIGTLNTILIVIVTAILGSYLVRSQGMQTLGKLQNSFNHLSDPTEPLAHGAMILFSGALLLTPGFFTDAGGFALLVPRVREIVFAHLRKRVRVQSFSFGAAQNGASQTGQAAPDPRRPAKPASPEVIDGEFTEVDPAKRPTHRPSGWTRH